MVDCFWSKLANCIICADFQERYEALLSEVLSTVRETQEQEEKTAAAAVILRQQASNKQACFIIDHKPTVLWFEVSLALGVFY